jgi:hypothetical protein
MPSPERSDLRKYSRQTQFRMLLGGVGLFLLVGNGLIWLIYGQSALGSALLCSVLGLMPLALIAAWIGLLKRISERYRDE